MSSFGVTRWFGGAGLVFGMCLVVGWAQAEYQPVLHELFEPDPKEDIAFGARVTSAALPAAIETKEGIQSLPNPIKPLQRTEPIYRETRNNSVPSLQMDNQTTDPGRLDYHEPFRPSIAPFKRTHVYDSVTEAFTLVVSDPRVRPVTLSEGPTESMDSFFADLAVDVKGNEPVVIPSAGPNMKVFSAHLEPEVPFGFYVDRADNWFLRAPTAKGRSRLVLHIGVERASFHGQIEAASYSNLLSALPSVPANVERAVAALLPKIGVSRVMAPVDAVSRLVSYFRGFSVSAERPDATSGEALYRELVTSRKGVCRHRAYAFMITALGLGIPTRFVHNEAHAWVEVFGGTLWHRIDLGGAASSFGFRGEPPVGKPYQPPSDPFEWPQKSAQTERALPSVTPTLETKASASEQGAASSRVQPSAVSREPVREQSPLPQPSETASSLGRISVSIGADTRVLRSQSITVTGSVDSAKGGCGNVFVEFALVQNNRSFTSGATMTDPNGRFSTKLVVPSNLSVGNYELLVTSRATKTCPAATN